MRLKFGLFGKNSHKIALNATKANLNPNPYFLFFGDQFDILEGYENVDKKIYCKNFAMRMTIVSAVSMETIPDN